LHFFIEILFFTRIIVGRKKSGVDFLCDLPKLIWTRFNGFNGLLYQLTTGKLLKRVQNILQVAVKIRKSEKRALSTNAVCVQVVAKPLSEHSRDGKRMHVAVVA
jgi:hypothetical protein